MCNKLLQTYACGHCKSVCTTPCAHTLKPTQVTANLNASTITVSRSNSTVFSIAPVSRSLSTNFSRPHTHSPQRVTNIPSASTSPTQVSAVRLVPPSTPSPTSPVLPVSSSFSNIFHTSAPSSRFPSPALFAAEEGSESKFCSYYIPRYLVTSKHPCIECYGKPEWEGLRAKWIENYRWGHLLDRGEDVEVVSGAKDVLERGG